MNVQWHSITQRFVNPSLTHLLNFSFTVYKVFAVCPFKISIFTMKCIYTCIYKPKKYNVQVHRKMENLAVSLSRSITILNGLHWAKKKVIFTAFLAYSLSIIWTIKHWLFKQSLKKGNSAIKWLHGIFINKRTVFVRINFILCKKYINQSQF